MGKSQEFMGKREPITSPAVQSKTTSLKETNVASLLSVALAMGQTLNCGNSAVAAKCKAPGGSDVGVRNLTVPDLTKLSEIASANMVKGRAII